MEKQIESLKEEIGNLKKQVKSMQRTIKYLCKAALKHTHHRYSAGLSNPVGISGLVKHVNKENII